MRELPAHLMDVEYASKEDVLETFHDEIVELIEDGEFDEAVIDRMMAKQGNLDLTIEQLWSDHFEAIASMVLEGDFDDEVEQRYHDKFGLPGAGVP